MLDVKVLSEEKEEIAIKEAVEDDIDELDFTSEGREKDEVPKEDEEREFIEDVLDDFDLDDIVDIPGLDDLDDKLLEDDDDIGELDDLDDDQEY